VDLNSGGFRFKVDQETSYPGVLRGYPQSFEANSGILARSGHDRLHSRSVPSNFMRGCIPEDLTEINPKEGRFL
jgi:hypothetical protein